MLTATQELSLSRSDAEDFLFRQSECIDTRDFASWIDLFTPDGIYWIPARFEDTDPKTQLSFLYDDVPNMVARCERLLDPGTAGQQPFTRSSHIVSNVRVAQSGTKGELVVRSRFHVTQFRRDVLKSYSGSYTHHLVARG